MKLKRFLIGLFLVLALCLPSFAEAQLPHVTDEAGLLTEEQLSDLEALSQEQSALWDCGIYVVTLADYEDYFPDRDLEAAVEALYLGNGFGVGSEQNGILLMLSMAKRDYALYAFGYGNIAFTDYGKEVLADAFLEELGNDNWYEGFVDYIEQSAYMLDLSRNGQPIDVDQIPTEPVNPLIPIGIGTALGFLIALIVLLVLKHQLKSVSAGSQADAYVTEEGLELQQRVDQYLYTTQSRVYDPPEKDSGSGGTTLTSSGGSSSSGKF